MMIRRNECIVVKGRTVTNYTMRACVESLASSVANQWRNLREEYGNVTITFAEDHAVQLSSVTATGSHHRFLWDD